MNYDTYTSKIVKLMLQMAMLAYTFQAEAQYAKPFGKLSWDDSIVTSIEKLDSMGADSITLQMEQTKLSFKKKDLPKSKAELEKKLKDMFLQEYQIAPEKASERLMFDNFIDAKGNTSRYYLKTLLVRADNLILSNVKCSILLRFEARPEVAAVKPENSYTLSGKLFFSPMLASVDLNSSADNVKDNYQTIKAAIADKYFTDPQGKSQFIQFGVIQYPDTKGLSGEIKESHLSINYRNEAPSEILKQYENLKSELETKKNSGKKDLSSGL